MQSDISESTRGNYASGSLSPEPNLERLLSLAYDHQEPTAFESVQRLLARIHEYCFCAPREASSRPLSSMADDLRVALEIEQRMLEYEAQWIDVDKCPDARKGGDDFVRGLKALVREHPSGKHPFYTEFLPLKSSVADIAFYLAQESKLDPRFDDFIALMQIGLPVGPKLELAANYWDEMGNGSTPRVHTVMFQMALVEVGATEDYIAKNVMVEALVCGNLTALFALRKPLVYRAVGSFAVTELLFPRRCSQLRDAWRRNGLSASGLSYHTEHVGIDARHAAGFFRSVIAPLVDAHPEMAGEIYWGACARLNSSNRYLDALLQRFTGGDQ